MIIFNNCRLTYKNIFNYIKKLYTSELHELYTSELL